MTKLRNSLFVFVLAGAIASISNGCGKQESTIVKPDMTPEEFQAKVEAEAAEMAGASKE